MSIGRLLDVEINVISESLSQKLQQSLTAVIATRNLKLYHVGNASEAGTRQLEAWAMSLYT